MSSPAGWYVDPEASNGVRYWDGERWTDAQASRYRDAYAPPEARHSRRTWKQALITGLVMVAALALIQVGFSVYSWFTHPLAFPCCSAVPTYSVSRTSTVEAPLTLNVGAVPKRLVTITSVSAMTYPSRLAATITYTLCDAPSPPNSDARPVACVNPRDPIGQLFTPGTSVLLMHVVAHQTGTLQIHGTDIEYREGHWRHGGQVTGGQVTVQVVSDRELTK